MKTKNVLAVLVTSAALLMVGNAMAQWNLLLFESSPESYVGHNGQTFDIGSPEYVFTDNSGPNGIGDFILTIHTPDWSSVWGLEFATADGTDFQSGTTYAGAQRAPFQEPGHPGLGLYGDSRGYNASSGWFKVLDFERLNGMVTHAEIQFYQHGDDFHGTRESWESGTLSYSVPEPATCALVGVSLAAMLIFRRRY